MGQASGSRPTAIRTVSFRHGLRGWARQLSTGNCPVCNTRVCARIIPPFFRLGFGDIFYRTKPISSKAFVVIVLHAIHSISDQVWGNCSERPNGVAGHCLKARNSFVNDPAGYSGRTPLGECGGPLNTRREDSTTAAGIRLTDWRLPFVFSRLGGMARGVIVASGACRAP